MFQDLKQWRSSDPHREVRRVLIVSAGWTLVVWGSRVGLLDDQPSAWSQARIAVSLTFGVALLAFGWRATASAHRPRLTIMVAYTIWMVVVWVPSLVDTLGSDQSFAFQVIHTGLAIGSLASGALVANTARMLALYPRTITSTRTDAKSAAR